QFDPITNGHLDVIRRGVALFDQVIVAVCINPRKNQLFSLAERLPKNNELLQQNSRAQAAHNEDLTPDFLRSVNTTTPPLGIREVSDLRYEFQLAQANRAVGGVETVFIMTGDQYALTSSSLIRQIVTLGADLAKLQPLVPASVIDRLKQMKKRGIDLRTRVP